MQQNNMIQGSIVRKLVTFALPLLVGSLVQQLYHTVDLIFVGNLLGKEATAAVGSSSLLVGCMVGFFTGIGVGASLVAARYFGANEPGKIRETTHTALLVGLLGGGILTVLCYGLTPFFLRLLKTPADIFIQATAYTRVYFLCLIPLVLYNIGAGLLRAFGDSKSPLWYQLIGGLCNIAANVLFVWLLGWGVVGSAAASVLSQLLAAGLILWHFLRMPPPFQLQCNCLRITQSILTQFLTLGIPAGVQAVAITLSNLLVQSQINLLGIDSIAAFTAYFKVELFIYLPIMALGQAFAIFTGQNVGAGQPDRIRRGLRTGLLLGMGVTVALSAFVLLAARPVFLLFTADAQVLQIGLNLAWRAFPFYFLYLILEVLSSTARGLGRAVAPMTITLVNFCVVRVLVLFLFLRIEPTAESVVVIYPITWAITAGCLWLYYLYLSDKGGLSR